MRNKYPQFCIKERGVKARIYYRLSFLSYLRYRPPYRSIRLQRHWLKSFSLSVLRDLGHPHFEILRLNESQKTKEKKEREQLTIPCSPNKDPPPAVRSRPSAHWTWGEHAVSTLSVSVTDRCVCCFVSRCMIAVTAALGPVPFNHSQVTRLSRTPCLI